MSGKPIALRVISGSKGARLVSIRYVVAQVEIGCVPWLSDSETWNVKESDALVEYPVMYCSTRCEPIRGSLQLPSCATKDRQIEK